MGDTDVGAVVVQPSPGARPSEAGHYPLLRSALPGDLPSSPASPLLNRAVASHPSGTDGWTQSNFLPI